MSSAAPSGDPFSALGDPHRRSIVELLGGGGRSVRQIADELPISRPAVSRHLRLLKDAGLVVEEARGTQRIYRLHDQGVAAVQQYLHQVWGEAAARLRMFAENTGDQQSVVTTSDTTTSDTTTSDTTTSDTTTSREPDAGEGAT